MIEIGCRTPAVVAHRNGVYGAVLDPPLRATYGRVACVIRSLLGRVGCYQLQCEAQFFMCAIPPLLACKGFV
jgi:hypothetical protein